VKSSSLAQDEITKSLSFGQTPKTPVSFLGCRHFFYCKTSLSSCFSISEAILEVIASHRSLPGVYFYSPPFLSAEPQRTL